MELTVPSVELGSKRQVPKLCMMLVALASAFKSVQLVPFLGQTTMVVGAAQTLSSVEVATRVVVYRVLLSA